MAIIGSPAVRDLEPRHVATLDRSSPRLPAFPLAGGSRPGVGPGAELASG